MSAAVVVVSGLFVVKPLYGDVNENKAELATLQAVTVEQEAELATLENGVSNYEEIQAYVSDFLNSVSTTKDVESASRSVSSAAVPGIRITSFSFGSAENITEHEIPTAVLSGYTPPLGFGEIAVTEPVEGEVPETVEAFHRIPVEIAVTASDYPTLSTYVDNLSKQERLMNVLSVTSTKNSTEEGSEITATIYAYAFVYVR